ncbi:unnamed protein product [Nesidiocoris tenuis]|uniref:CBM21 domain-containing protein n=1 Tax=Nesidiocoris tenuis TaxID=355587 RepID=A0A6H5GWD4_9HEMI|nr:unnamed protein product [Nesidiocoris tenuis]
MEVFCVIWAQFVFHFQAHEVSTRNKFKLMKEFFKNILDRSTLKSSQNMIKSCHTIITFQNLELLCVIYAPLHEMSGPLDASLPEGFLHERLLETRGSSASPTGGLYSRSPPSFGSLVDFYKDPPLPVQDFRTTTAYFWKSTPPSPTDSPSPLKKKSSSLKSTSKNASNGEKKIVRFADVMGLDLADVHTFLDEIPRIPKSAFKDLKDKDAPALPKINNGTLSPMAQRKTYSSKVDRNLVPLFVQPTSRPDFLDRLTRQKICLENAFVTNTNCLNIRGTLRVVNLDFHKQVTARISKDRWRTNQDIPCNFLECCPDGGFSDRFAFVIPGDDLLPGCRLEIALRYVVTSAEFWDNNNGQNYGFHAVHESRGGGQTADVMLSHPSTIALESWGSSTHSWAY